MPLGRRISWMIALGMICLLPFVAEAHFICGTVNDAADGTSAAWKTVYIYQGSISANRSCQVGSEDNAYCCDLELLNASWTIGSMVNSILPDDSSGYVAGPVNVTTTGEGYDTAPTMRLEPIVSLGNLSSSYTVSNFTINLSVKAPYTNSIFYSLSAGNTTLCTGCAAYNLTLTGLTDGSYTLRVYADDASGTIRSSAGAFTVTLPSTTVTATPAASSASSTGAAGYMSPVRTWSFTQVIPGKSYIITLPFRNSSFIKIMFWARTPTPEAKVKISIGQDSQAAFTILETLKVESSFDDQALAKVEYYFAEPETSTFLIDASGRKLSYVNEGGMSKATSNFLTTVSLALPVPESSPPQDQPYVELPLSPPAEPPKAPVADPREQQVRRLVIKQVAWEFVYIGSALFFLILISVYVYVPASKALATLKDRCVSRFKKKKAKAPMQAIPTGSKQEQIPKKPAAAPDESDPYEDLESFMDERMYDEFQGGEQK